MLRPLSFRGDAMAHHDLRSFLDALHARGQLADVPLPVDPELESTALCLR